MPASDDVHQGSREALLWSSVGAMVRLLAQLGIQVMLARVLGPVAFGEFAAVLVIVGIGWLLAERGLGAALIQKAVLSERDLGYSLAWTLIISGIIGLGVMLLASQFAWLLGDPGLATMLLGCSVLIPLQALSNLPSSLMQRNLDMKRLQLIQLGAYVVAYGGVGLALAHHGAGGWSLIVAFGVQLSLNLMAGWACTRFPLRLRLRGDPVMRNFSAGVLATNLANWAVVGLDLAIVGRQWGITALGEYNVAANLSRVPATLIVYSVQSVAFATASRLQQDNLRLRHGLLTVLSMTGLMTFVPCALLAVHADLVIGLIYGESWASAAPLFAAFCVGTPFFALLAVTSPILWAVGDPASELRVQIVTAVALVGALMLLGGKSLAIAVWCIPLIYAVRFALTYRVLAQRIGLQHTHAIRALAGSAALALIAVAASQAVTAIAGSGLHAQLGAIMAGIAAAAATLRLMPDALIGPAFRDALLAQVPYSRLARLLCRYAGVRPKRS